MFYFLIFARVECIILTQLENDKILGGCERLL